MTKQPWWHKAVVYQVYWRSFYDTNGDGIGDLEGVIQKLDYIKNLGANVIWLNPCYESPDVDNGYDISDYRSIMPKAGNLDSFERLLNEVHRRDMFLIMDLVVNHTSNQHPWFLQSKASRINPYRDYYIWRDKPNNWRSYFTPSTWEYDDTTSQYYFHSFATEQPDLNWANPALRQEIYKLLRFWLDKGIDGFRLDAIALLAKQAGFPDAETPGNIRYLTNNPLLHEYLQEMNAEVFSKYDIFTVGEAGFTTPEQGVLYVDEARQELNTIFHFQVLDEMPSWDLRRFRDIQTAWNEALRGRGWNSQFLNNHDHTRFVTRYGNDKEYRRESATAFATLIHTLPGIPYIYQGEEIGMTGVRFETIEDYDDIAMKNRYKEEIEKGRDSKEVFEELLPLSRDNSRTPMQWSSGLHAGFTSGTPWIKVNPNYKEINVEKDLSDPNSIYHYYQKLIRLRKQYEVLIYGEYEVLLPNHPELYVYSRTHGREKLFIVLNLASRENEYSVPENCELVLGNYTTPHDKILRPYEARVYMM